MLGIYHDVFMALKITIECLEGGIENCICAVALMLRPEWLSPSDYRYSPEQKCYTGDPLNQIIDQIGHMLLGGIGDFFKGFASIFSLPFSGPSAIDVIDKQTRTECETPDRFGHGDADKVFLHTRTPPPANAELWRLRVRGCSAFSHASDSLRGALPLQSHDRQALKRDTADSQWIVVPRCPRHQTHTGHPYPTPRPTLANSQFQCAYILTMMYLRVSA